MIDYREEISIKVEEKLCKKKREEEKLLCQKGITQEGFRVAVEEKMARGKVSFILAVYQTFDEFLKKEIEKTGIVLACEKGCSTCCYQMVTCTETEINEVIKLIKGIEREARRKLIWQVEKGIKKWKKYFGRNATILERNPFQVLVDWQGKPCVFLDERDGTCNIYPVRIMDCRTSTSLTPCGSGVKCHIPCELDWSGPGRLRFQCENWANNMIVEEQKKKFGYMAVSPILHWLTIKERELC